MTTPLCRFDVVTLDILSFGKQCKNGFDSVVVFTDRLSKRSYIAPCYKTSTAADLVRIFFETVFRNQGMSRVLLSDNGPQCHSEFWTEFFALLRTEVKLTSSYHPQSNGGSEKALRSYVSVRQDDWDTYLVYMNLRTTILSMYPLVLVPLIFNLHNHLTRDALYKTAQDFRLRHDATCKPHS